MTGSWDGSPIVADLETLILGLHNLTLVVYDLGDNMASDQVDITVIDDTPPSITQLIDQDVAEGSPVSLTWTVSDLHPDTFEISEDEKFKV